MSMLPDFPAGALSFMRVEFFLLSCEFKHLQTIMCGEIAVDREMNLFHLDASC